MLHALLAATVPLSLIGNTWVFPLQTALVAGWFIYRAISGERDHWLAGLFGAGAASALAYPFLVGFLQQPAAHTTALRLTRAGQHATPVEWLSVFWPLVLLMALAFWNREKRGLSDRLGDAQQCGDLPLLGQMHCRPDRSETAGP